MTKEELEEIENLSTAYFGLEDHNLFEAFTLATFIPDLLRELAIYKLALNFAAFHCNDYAMRLGINHEWFTDQWGDYFIAQAKKKLEVEK